LQLQGLLAALAVQHAHVLGNSHPIVSNEIWLSRPDKSGCQGIYHGIYEILLGCQHVTKLVAGRHSALQTVSFMTRSCTSTCTELSNNQQALQLQTGTVSSTAGQEQSPMPVQQSTNVRI
jgi:hypothetical protein